MSLWQPGQDVSIACARLSLKAWWMSDKHLWLGLIRHMFIPSSLNPYDPVVGATFGNLWLVHQLPLGFCQRPLSYCQAGRSEILFSIVHTYLRLMIQVTQCVRI